MPAIGFDDFDALTFDCYGTLVDWERGILAGLRPALNAYGIAAGDEELLQAYGRTCATETSSPARCGVSSPTMAPLRPTPRRRRSATRSATGRRSQTPPTPLHA